MSLDRLLQAKLEVGAVVARMQDDWKDYPLLIEIDNRCEINYAEQTDPFLQITMRNMGGEQMDLGDDAWTEQDGQLLISAVVKAGQGTNRALELLGFASRYFHRKDDFQLVRFQAAVATGGKADKEWWHETCIVPYWYQWK